MTERLTTQHDLTDLVLEGIQCCPESHILRVEDVGGENSQLLGIDFGLVQLRRCGVSEESRVQPLLTIGGARDASTRIKVDQGEAKRMVLGELRAGVLE